MRDDAVGAAGPVTVELFRVPARRVPAAVGRMATDRLRLANTPGLRFHKLVGTGDGRTFDFRDADLRTWGLVAVWADNEAARRYAAASPVARGWRRLSEEAWRAWLRPIATRGQWSGREPFVCTPGDRGDGPVAAITRARLRPSRAAAFWRAVPPVTVELHAQPGLRLAVGIGEAPVGLQGTFSVWDSDRDLTDFAYRRPAHRAVVDATPRERWYSEELFTRFAVERTEGTIFGSDPAGPQLRDD